MNAQEMPPEQFAALPEAHQEHLMRHGTLPPDAEQPAAAAEAPATPEPAPEPAQPAPAAQAPEKKGDPEVPLRQTREELRQAQATLEQFQKFASDPQALRKHLATLDPGPAPDFDLDPQAALQHHLAPVLKQVEDLKAELNQTKAQRLHEQYMGSLASKHGPEFHSTLAGFDAANPHLAHLDPEVRYFAGKGLAASAPPDPKAHEEAVTAAAEKLLASKLAGGKAPLPNLGNAPAVKGVDAGPQFDPNMGMSDFDKLTDAQIREMGRNLGKK